MPHEPVDSSANEPVDHQLLKLIERKAERASCIARTIQYKCTSDHRDTRATEWPKLTVPVYTNGARHDKDGDIQRCVSKREPAKCKAHSDNEQCYREKGDLQLKRWRSIHPILRFNYAL